MQQIPFVTIIECNEDLILEEGDILMMLDISKRYADYVQVFSKEQATCLPKHTKWDYHIPLKDPNGKIPAGRAIYKTTWEEKDALKKHLDDNLPSGKVRRSRLKTSAPILFIRKANSTLRLCVDYQTLNSLTIPNRYPLPRIDDLLERTRGSTWFTKLDLKNGYYLM